MLLAQLGVDRADRRMEKACENILSSNLTKVDLQTNLGRALATMKSRTKSEV